MIRNINRNIPNRLIIIGGILLASLIVIGVLSVSTTYSVPVSNDAVLVNTISGDISECNCPATTQFFAKAPWVNVVNIPTSVNTLTLEGNKTGIFVLSQDNLEIEFDVNIRYQILANHAVDLYKKFPSQNWEQAAIEPHIRAAFRDVVAKYPADQIQLVRDQIQLGVEREISDNIGNDTSLVSAVNIVSTQITDITLPSSFTNAIQAKLNAQQQFLQAQFEAQKTVLLATAQANATIQQAIGVKTSQLIIANGTSASLHYIGQQLGLNESQVSALTQTYVFMQQLQSLCQQSNAPCQNMIMMLGGQNGQIFQIPITKSDTTTTTTTVTATK